MSSLEHFLDWLYDKTIFRFKEWKTIKYVQKHYPKGSFVEDHCYDPCVIVNNDDELLEVISLSSPEIGLKYCSALDDCRVIDLAEALYLLDKKKQKE